MNILWRAFIHFDEGSLSLLNGPPLCFPEKQFRTVLRHICLSSKLLRFPIQLANYAVAWNMASAQRTLHLTSRARRFLSQCPGVRQPIIVEMIIRRVACVSLFFSNCPILSPFPNPTLPPHISVLHFWSDPFVPLFTYFQLFLLYFLPIFFAVPPFPFFITSNTAVMRRFSSEGSLLDLDFPTWKKVALKNSGQDHESGTCTLHLQDDELAGKSGRLTPIIQEPTESPGEMTKNELTREHSVSAENLCELSKLEKSQLRGCLISQGSRAYSDSQLAPAVQGSTESMEKADRSPSSPSSSSSSFKMEHRHQQRDRLTAAKLHIKSLFAQVQ